MVESELRLLIRDVPDFPEPGILFRDITPLLADPMGFRSTIDLLAEPFVDGPDVVVGIEARGFLFGTPVAMALGCPFVPVRKPNKLPRETTSFTYDLEYGTDTLEIHHDALGPEARVLIVDDVLATGGTAAAAASLVEETGARVVAVAAVVELAALGGRKRLAGRSVHSVLRYD
jgi:adenine phosphoribosyltransferase